MLSLIHSHTSLDHLQHTVDIYGHVEPAVETPAERKEKYFAVTGENLHKQAFNLRQRARQDQASVACN